MSTKRLWLSQIPDPLTIHDFVWRPVADGPRSLKVNIEPTLAELGTVPLANREAVWLATTVFLADRTTPRGKGWQRQLRIVTPCANPDRWTPISDEVDAILSFLTSDEWSTTFVLDPLGSETNREGSYLSYETLSDVVCLFSGGADSVCGAVRALTEGHHVTLMSHWDWAGHSTVQSQLVDDLQIIFGVEIPHVRVNLGRSAKQIGGAQFRDEPSRRSRSLLFVTLGLAVASARGAIPLWISESGFTSLNLPLASERRGALSTRTTHPAFLGGLQRIMQSVGAHADFRNLFKDTTKGEMFTSVANAIGKDMASELLSNSHSCSHVRWAMSYGRPPGTQCGVCLGCIVRRAAFIAADLEDRTTYLVTDLTEPNRSRFLKSMARPEIETTRYAISREFGLADVLTLDLPNDYDLEDALRLVRRGFREIAALELP